MGNKSPDPETFYEIVDPGFLAPVTVKWRKSIDILQAAKDLSALLSTLMEELKASIDPYAEDGIQYLEEYVAEMTTWEPRLPDAEAIKHIARVFFVLQGIHEEIDRVDDDGVNNLVQQIREKTQFALERVYNTPAIR